MGERQFFLLEAAMHRVIEKYAFAFLLIIEILDMIRHSITLLKYRDRSWKLVIPNLLGNNPMFK